MKTFGKMSFGFSIVNAGQRQTVVEPQLVFVSTPGSIRITAPVSKALGIQHGDNVMFINNIPDIDEAIRSENEELVAFANENGLTWGSSEANAAIHAAFDAWWIGKGIQLFDKKGNPKMVKVWELGKHNKWYKGNNKYPSDCVLLEGPEVTMYLLKNTG